MERNHSITDLNVTAVGRCFSDALDHVTARTLSDHNTLGRLLLEQFHRRGFALTAMMVVSVTTLTGCTADAEDTGTFRSPNLLPCLDLAEYHRLTLMEFVSKHPAGPQCGGIFVTEGLMSVEDFRAACDAYWSSRPDSNPPEVL